MTVLERIERQAEEASRQADRLTKIAALVRELGEDGLQELLGVLEEERPESNGNGNGHKPETLKEPRGREAIRLIVRERPGIWTLRELRAEMKARGWYTSDTGVEAAAKRLCDVNLEGRRIGRGRFVFPSNYGEEGVIESDASDGATIPFDALTG
jgi:hypothetical protein